MDETIGVSIRLVEPRVVGSTLRAVRYALGREPLTIRSLNIALSGREGRQQKRRIFLRVGELREDVRCDKYDRYDRLNVIRGIGTLRGGIGLERPWERRPQPRRKANSPA